jgi:hypothetical protein
MAINLGPDVIKVIFTEKYNETSENIYELEDEVKNILQSELGEQGFKVDDVDFFAFFGIEDLDLEAQLEYNIELISYLVTPEGYDAKMSVYADVDLNTGYFKDVDYDPEDIEVIE